MGINVVSTAFFASVAHAKRSFAIVITRGLIAVLVFVFLLSGLWGMTGVWLTIPATEITTLLLTTIFLALYQKQLNKTTSC